MYYKQNPDQETIEDFFLPFGGKLRADNRWIRLSKIIPWDKIDEIHGGYFRAVWLFEAWLFIQVRLKTELFQQGLMSVHLIGG